MDNILRWNWPNFFTVGLMALIFAGVIGFAASFLFGSSAAPSAGGS